MTTAYTADIAARMLAYLAVPAGITADGGVAEPDRAAFRTASGASAIVFAATLATLRRDGLVDRDRLFLTDAGSARLQAGGSLEPPAPPMAPPSPPAQPVSEATSLRDQVKAETEQAGNRRRRAATPLGGDRRSTDPDRTGPLTPAEVIATEWLSDPSDLVGHIRRRWPDLWQTNLARARAAGVTPLASLFDVLERGLAA